MRTFIKLATLAFLLVPAPALADPESTALVVDGTHILARDGVHAGASGLGAELRFFEDDECMTGGFGAFAAIGAPGTEQRRDVIDAHVSIGVKHGKRLAPYAGLGLDVLHITTHQPDRTLRGTTLGISAQVGILGRVGDKLFVRANGGYLGAIVPGTGDDLGGWVLQAGIGWMIDD